MARCSLCQAPIQWARTEAGKSMPLSLPPVTNGNIWLEEREIKGEKKSVACVATAERPVPDGKRRFRAHFLECAPHIAQKDIERRLKAST